MLHSGSTTTMDYSSVPRPASPTLTNPDMILPYGKDYSPASPKQTAYRPGTSDENWSIDDMEFSIGNAHVMPITPTTPIIYGNGTMLSDIGEVTEAESTPVRKLPGPAERRILKQAQNTYHAHASSSRSSPTVGHHPTNKHVKPAARLRSGSIESMSTVTSKKETLDVFKDFDDDRISVDDSVFQGDDEESVADLYSEEVIASETQRLARRDDIVAPEEDKNSSAALSRRAEQILLNAKKRLNNMEGNLTRARSSLFINASGSIHSSSPLSRPPPSPQPRTQDQSSVQPAKHREAYHDDFSTSPGHSRVYSENSISPPLYSTFPIRPASAAARYIGRGRLEMGQPSPPLDRTPENVPPRSTLHSSLSKNSSTTGTTLEPLSEDDVLHDSDRRSVRSSIGDRFSINEGHRLTRSTSTMQMRDLKDQMQDLKGRLSVLRDQARDDTMKRRSLQSLRTPSPFTMAEQWYTSSPVYGDGGLSADAGVAWKPEPSEQSIREVAEEQSSQPLPQYAESDVTSVYEDVDDVKYNQQAIEPSPVIREQLVEEEGEEEEGEVVEEDGYDTATEGEIFEGDQDGESVDDYNEEMVDREELDEDYESDESLYHDTVPPLSHEDREDAFDYEHFFLHSAMGTMSQQKNRRDSTGSCSSEDSVETARGPVVPLKSDEMTSRTALGHLRSESTDSVSTMVTFATAREETADEGGENQNNFAVQEVDQEPIRETTSVEVKRSTFGSGQMDAWTVQLESAELASRPGSVIHDPELRSGSNIHRPSISSFDSLRSIGTTRSFPLVNKPRSRSTGASSTPDFRAREQAGSFLSESTTLTENGNPERSNPSPVRMLAKEDQLLVERLVASLGKCVLGLQESEPSSSESKVWRRRLDAARRVLNGTEGTV